MQQCKAHTAYLTDKRIDGWSESNGGRGGGGCRFKRCHWYSGTQHGDKLILVGKVA